MFLEGILGFHYVKWTKNLNFVGSLVMEILIWTLYFITPKYLDYMQYYTMLPEQSDHIVAKDLATVTWLDEDQILACLVTWPAYCFALT